jgi:hypothetical protein
MMKYRTMVIMSATVLFFGCATPTKKTRSHTPTPIHTVEKEKTVQKPSNAFAYISRGFAYEKLGPASACY